MTRVKRGDLWLVDLNPQAFKEEPAKSARPCLVIQTDLLNEVGHSTVIIIPGTTQVYRDTHGDAYPLRVPLGRIQKIGEEPKETDLLIDQIRAISTRRLMGTAPVASLSANHMRRVQEALRLLLGF